jgi:hypothetical protein
MVNAFKRKRYDHNFFTWSLNPPLKPRHIDRASSGTRSSWFDRIAACSIHLNLTFRSESIQDSRSICILMLWLTDKSIPEVFECDARTTHGRRNANNFLAIFCRWLSRSREHLSKLSTFGIFSAFQHPPCRVGENSMAGAKVLNYWEGRANRFMQWISRFLPPSTLESEHVSLKIMLIIRVSRQRRFWKAPDWPCSSRPTSVDIRWEYEGSEKRQD